jgi:hypothetical protein
MANNAAAPTANMRYPAEVHAALRWRADPADLSTPHSKGSMAIQPIPELLLEVCMMVRVVSRVAEIGLFFGVASVLVAGILLMH